MVSTQTKWQAALSGKKAYTHLLYSAKHIVLTVRTAAQNSRVHLTPAVYTVVQKVHAPITTQHQACLPPGCCFPHTTP